MKQAILMTIDNKLHIKQNPSRLSNSLPGWGGETSSLLNNQYTIGILLGEGIGKEILETVVQLLKTIQKYSNYQFDLRYGGLIGGDAKKIYGKALTSEVVEWCQSIFNEGGAILCGPGGSRFVYEMRQTFDLFCKFTPIKPQTNLQNTGILSAKAIKDVDMVIVRENASGLYFGETHTQIDSQGIKKVSHTFSYREDEVERILQTAVSLAKSRQGKLSLVVKNDGVPGISQLWVDIFNQLIAGESLETSVLDVDNANYQIIAAAPSFDVIVTPNLFGDILSDTAALLLGSRGLSYSGNFGQKGIATYQTGHGAAYDIQGKNIANPIGQILSAAMMLRESFGLFDIAYAIVRGIENTLAKGIRTFDIATANSTIVGTAEMGQYIADAVAQELSENLSQELRT